MAPSVKRPGPGIAVATYGQLVFEACPGDGCEFWLTATDQDLCVDAPYLVADTPLFYQWEELIGTTWTPISGATEPTYSRFWGWSAPGAHSVRCKVNDDGLCAHDPEFTSSPFTVTVVEVAAISGPDEAYVNTDATFQTTTNPTGHEHQIQWSGGGEPETDTGPSFTTKWADEGAKTVEACFLVHSPGCCKTKDVTVTCPGIAVDGPGAVCANCNATFTVTTEPAGQEDQVTWTAVGGQPPDGSGKTFTTKWAAGSKAKTVTAWLGSCGKSVSVKVIKILSATVEPPPPLWRTKVGFGEWVTCWTEDGVQVTWSVDPVGTGGHVVPPGPAEVTTFYAPKPAEAKAFYSLVHAMLDEADCLIGFEVVPPSGCEWSGVGPYAPPTLEPGDALIFAGYIYKAVVTPSDVSFLHLECVDHVDEYTVPLPAGGVVEAEWNWPFHIVYHPAQGVNVCMEDRVATDIWDIECLVDESTHQYRGCGWEVNSPLQYLPDVGDPVPWLAENLNHFTFYWSTPPNPNGSGKVERNYVPGVVMGPWKLKQ